MLSHAPPTSTRRPPSPPPPTLQPRFVRSLPFLLFRCELRETPASTLDPPSQFHCRLSSLRVSIVLWRMVASRASAVVRIGPIATSCSLQFDREAGSAS